MAIRILGVDPGLRHTGFGIIDALGQKISYVASGVISTTHVDLGNLPERIKVLHEGMHEIIECYKPQVSAVEIVFVNVNPQSTLLLGQARGALLSALVSKGLPVSEYTALQLKKAVVGHGKARKEQVQEMVTRLLNLPGRPLADAADALGLAICHAHAGHSMNRLSQTVQLKRKTHAQFAKGRTY